MNNVSTRDRVYKYICDYWLKNHFGPELREITRGVGLASTSNISYHVDHLVESGQLEREPGVARSIRPANMKISIPR